MSGRLKLKYARSYIGSDRGGIFYAIAKPSIAADRKCHRRNYERLHAEIFDARRISVNASSSVAVRDALRGLTRASRGE